MTRSIRDLRGVTHRFEAASWHNTQCGQQVYTRLLSGVEIVPIGGRDGALLPEGIVDCMACLVGRSHVGMKDLRDGVAVQTWIRLDGEGGPVGSPQTITFTHGTNDNEVTFYDLPVGVIVYGYSYLDENSRRLHLNVFPNGISRRSEDDTIMIAIGKAKIQ